MRKPASKQGIPEEQRRERGWDLQLAEGRKREFMSLLLVLEIPHLSY